MSQLQSEKRATKVLIVEDDLDLVETYTDLLEAKRFSVMSVLRAADAIQLITRTRPEVIILDLNLPGESGIVVINFVRRYAPLAATKIIVATGHPDLIQQTGHVFKQIDAMLTKPVSNETLLKVLDDLFPPSG